MCVWICLNGEAQCRAVPWYQLSTQLYHHSGLTGPEPGPAQEPSLPRSALSSFLKRRRHWGDCCCSPSLTLPLALSFSISLSLSHTHTHTHTLGLPTPAPYQALPVESVPLSSSLSNSDCVTAASVRLKCVGTMQPEAGLRNTLLPSCPGFMVYTVWKKLSQRHCLSIRLYQQMGQDSSYTKCCFLDAPWCRIVFLSFIVAEQSHTAAINVMLVFFFFFKQ